MPNNSSGYICGCCQTPAQYSAKLRTFFQAASDAGNGWTEKMKQTFADIFGASDAIANSLEIVLDPGMISDAGAAFTAVAIGSRSVVSFSTDTQTANRDRFTQSGNKITYTTGQQFYEGQTVVVFFQSA